MVRLWPFNWRWRKEIAFIVPKNVFIPKPNVDSAVLATRRPAPFGPSQRWGSFLSVPLSKGQQRRRPRNNLKSAMYHDLLVKTAYVTRPQSFHCRAESLSLMDFAEARSRHKRPKVNKGERCQFFRISSTFLG